MHDCLRDLLVQLALSEICWDKVARRKLRRINYQRLMETFLNVHRRSFILRVQTSSMRWLFGILFLARVASLTLSQKKRQNAPAIHLHACCVKPFYSDGNALRCASQLSELLKQSIYMRLHGEFFFLFVFVFVFLLQRLLFAAYSTRIRGYSRPFQLIAVAMLCCIK